MEHIRVSVNDFEGPFDLLFHLIKKNKMDIRDIKITVLAEQYMGYVESIADKDMDGMSEFLLMAATLLEIKLKLLLPGPADEDEDPAETLAFLLEEYMRFKEVTNELNKMELAARRNVFKERDTAVAFLFDAEPDVLFDGLNAGGLYESFMDAIRHRDVRQDRNKKITGTIGSDHINVRRKMEHIRRLLAAWRRVRLSYLFGESETKEEMAVAFMGVLLLVKEETARVSQERLFGEVYVSVLNPGAAVKTAGVDNGMDMAVNNDRG